MANFIANAEEQIINQLATDCATITGIQNAYKFAQNPDSLPTGAIPAIVFYPARGEQEPAAHHNRWMNTINITGLLFVAQRMSMGGTLRFLENSTLGFPGLFRARFQTASVIQSYLALGAQTAWLDSWEYGVGGLLTYMGTEYIGLILNWTFRGTN